MNDEERLIWGKYLSTVATSRRQELEALDELLNELGKPILEPKEGKKPTEVQFNGLKWVTKEGTKGKYEQAENDKSENFRLIQQYVKDHSGFCHLYGWKVFFHYKNENLIDRKK